MNKLVSLKEMHSIKKFIFVPIGLPGMGKTTLSRYLSNNSKILFNTDQKSQSVDFVKISYDRMLTDNQRQY